MIVEERKTYIRSLLEEDELDTSEDTSLEDTSDDIDTSDSFDDTSTDSSSGLATDTDTESNSTDDLAGLAKNLINDLEGILLKLDTEDTPDLGPIGCYGPVLDRFSEEDKQVIQELIQEGVFKDIATSAKNTVKNFVSNTIVGDVIDDVIKPTAKKIKNKIAKKKSIKLTKSGKYDKRQKGKYGSDKYKTSRKVDTEKEPAKKNNELAVPNITI